MSIQTRGLVFATFFGNCLVVGLLVASLTTNYWVHSSAAKRHSNVTSREATGHLNFGLFSGYKELDVGFGTRPDTIDGMFIEEESKFRMKTIIGKNVFSICVYSQ